MNETLSSVNAAQLSANTTLSQNTQSANTTYKNIASASQDSDSMLKNAIEAARAAGFDGKFGMNTKEIQNMKDQVTSYVNKITTALSKLDAQDASHAFGPQIGEAVKVFVESIKKSTSILVTNMNSFKDDLTAIEESMKGKATSVTNVVTESASSLNSTASGWSYGSSYTSN